MHFLILRLACCLLRAIPEPFEVDGNLAINFE